MKTNLKFVRKLEGVSNKMSGHKQNKCSFCDKLGHNVRTCDRFKEEKLREKMRQREEEIKRAAEEAAQRKVEEARKAAEEAQRKAEQAAEAARLSAVAATKREEVLDEPPTPNQLVSKPVGSAGEIDWLFNRVRPIGQTSEYLLLKSLWEVDRKNFQVGGTEWFSGEAAENPYVSITYAAFGGRCSIQYRAFGERIFSDKIHFTHITTFNKLLGRETEIVRFQSKAPASVFTSVSRS